ncbi:leucyl aminopeptidase family protein [Caldinitratiruptor microaerophilus]|uniref:Probable cytosol aminopeptidase n=1 Tax=Caldinitratiruptor microaerophilus TaxID=671077 RepID=A0AA35G970_9FIRM|nr:leucyl aminopeptidase [Caldinitratiruptor microaerophilus]BDG59989.1 putative cytosol aminopeptidase [Caldinitratiruptor microaerophilus]
MTEVQVVTGNITDIDCDVLIVNLFEGVTRPGGATGAVDAALGGLISDAIRAGDLTGRWGETAILYTGGRIRARKVLVAGLGQAARFGYREVFRVAALAARAARASGATRIASIAHGAGIGGLDPARAAQFTVDGTLHGLYRFAGYRTEPQPERPQVEAFLLVERDPERARAMAEGARTGRLLAEAAAWARDLGNRPGNRLTAAMLADEAVAMARDTGLEAEVLGPEEAERLGMGLLLAVNRGSAEPARVIVLRHRGGRNSGRAASGQQAGGGWPLALVGKGLTFDTGGISIKPSENMWDMKFDMCGGAAVLGAMRAIAQLAVPLDVLAVVPATDNMPDGASYKPGDVIRGLSGKTVEIRSTDAEGRLILADGLAYAVREGARRLVTISTLTGGVAVALGSVRFGLLANDDRWYEEVAAAAEEAGERGWRLPSDEDYRELLRSPVADMTNGGRREASTIQGGVFLFQHVGGVPTVHMDIAATAWLRDKTAEADEGATAVGLRTLVATARRLAAAGG